MVNVHGLLFVSRAIFGCVSEAGTASKFSSGGAKEECVKENFFVKLFFA